METVLTRALQLRQTSHIKTKVALDCFRHTYSSALRSQKLSEYTHFKVSLPLNFLKASPGFTSVRIQSWFCEGFLIQKICFLNIYLELACCRNVWVCITSTTIFFITSTTVFFQHLGISKFSILVIDVSMKYVADNIWLGSV